MLVFAGAGAILYYALEPVTLRIAVGPQGSDDQKLVQAMAQAFARDRSGVRLSPIPTDGAVQSLALQGGPLDADELTQFERNPWYRDAVALRRWDDLAKVPGLDVPPLDHYRARLAMILKPR